MLPVYLAAAIPDDFFGPNGVAVAAVAGFVFLARLHFQHDKERDTELAEWKRLYLASRTVTHKAVAEAEGTVGIEP